MLDSNSMFKQLLLNATTSTITRVYPTQAEAHRQRFAMYNALRSMRRMNPPDPFGEMKDILEFTVKERPDGRWELRIQQKTSQLIDSLDAWTVEATGAPPQIINTPRIDTTTLQQQIANEAIETLDPTSPEDLRILRRVEINDWLEQMDSRPGFPYMDAIAALREAGDVSLQQFQHQLRDKGIWK